MVRLVKMNFILCILAFLFISCKTSKVSAVSKEEQFVKKYLSDRYNTEFELISLNKANAPGDKVNNYEAELRSVEYDRRIFYVTFTGKDEFQINVDDFPLILMEEAFLKNLDLAIYKDFPLVFELKADLVENKYLDGINTIEDAAENLSSLKDSNWNFYIYTIVENYEDRVFEVEDMIINVLRQSYKLLQARTVADVYIYDDASLTETDIVPDMDKGKFSRTQQKDKVVKRWILAWTPTKLEEFSNGFQSVVKKRQERRS